MAARLGRPPKENRKSKEIHIRVTPEEKAEVMEYSHRTGITLLALLQKGIEADKAERKE